MIDRLVPQYIKSLTQVHTWLDKAMQDAEVKKYDANILLQTRLAPNMLPLIKQIQIMTDAAKLAVGRLGNNEAPVFDDKETSMAEVRTRLNKTLEYLKKSHNFEGYENKKIVQPRTPDKFLTGQEYFEEHANPNFYFHLTMTYALLRHNGIELGKKDYLGPLNYKDLK